MELSDSFMLCNAVGFLPSVLSNLACDNKNILLDSIHESKHNFDSDLKPPWQNLFA